MAFPDAVDRTLSALVARLRMPVEGTSGMTCWSTGFGCTLSVAPRSFMKAEALAAASSLMGAEEPLALIRQFEYIAEDEPQYVHVRKERITEWPVEFQKRPRRTNETIPNFLSPKAPANRLDVLRGF